MVKSLSGSRQPFWSWFGVACGAPLQAVRCCRQCRVAGGAALQAVRSSFTRRSLKTHEYFLAFKYHWWEWLEYKKYNWLLLHSLTFVGCVRIFMGTQHNIPHSWSHKILLGFLPDNSITLHRTRLLYGQTTIRHNIHSSSSESNETRFGVTRPQTGINFLGLNVVIRQRLNKTLVEINQLGCLLNLPIFVEQKAAAPK